MTRPACASESRTTSKKPKRRADPRAVAAALAVAALLSCRADRGPEPLPEAPRRIVTLAPNLTEIVYALGAQDRLIAVSDYSDYPPAARQLPRVGGLDASAERI